MNRRQFITSNLLLTTGLITPTIPSYASGGNFHNITSHKKAKIIIIGGGFAGYAVAQQLLKWSHKVHVTLIEPQPSFISCPMSNLALGISAQSLKVIHSPHQVLKQQYKTESFQYISGSVIALDEYKRQLTVALGKNSSHLQQFFYDDCVIATGLEFLPIGVDNPMDVGQLEKKYNMVHGWKASHHHSKVLQEQLKNLKKGGVVAMTIPKAPYKCPPGPYERACLMAEYLQKINPTASLHVYDANAEIISKKTLFMQAFATYENLKYYPDHVIQRLNPLDKKIHFEYGETASFDVCNIIPAQSAALKFAPQLKNKNQHWVGVNWWDCQINNNAHIYAAGDITFSAEKMPKSAQMATQHGKRIALILALKYEGNMDFEIIPAPIYKNICYSYVRHNQAIHITSHHEWDFEKKTVIPKFIGLSDIASSQEANDAQLWAKGIWRDTFLSK
jgi:sulfide dehydrogenase [flavocytochrome c] flavoprotein subunit